MFRAVFFDLDGTLADSVEDLATATNYALSKYGFPKREVKQYRYFAGDGFAKMIERAMPDTAEARAVFEELKKTFTEYYNKHYYDKTVAYDGLSALVKRLKAEGIKLAVVTNKNQSMAELVVGKLFGDSFDLVLGMREGIPAKPDPTAIYMAMEQLGVVSAETAFVGDTSMDITAGINASLYSIGVLWGFREAAELIGAGANTLVKNAAELERAILGDGLNG